VTLDEALDELYGAPLDAFVAERKRLAKELPAEERGDFTALRKPSIAAWTLNQLARQHRRDVDLLLDAGHRMRQAGLDKAAVDRARASEADAIKRLMRAAEQLGASAQALTKVNESLRAAAVSEEGRELLARGRFTEPVQATGFEAYAGLELPKRPRRRAAQQRPAPTRQSAERRRAEAELERLRKRQQTAQERADALASEVEAAERRLRELDPP
jgi:hypothetical protein